MQFRLGKISARIPIPAEPVIYSGDFCFLKTYATEEVLRVIAQADRKTFRKWSWTIVTAISNLKLVSNLLNVQSTISDHATQIVWNERLDCGHAMKDKVHVVRISVDGTDFLIQEPIPFDSMWFSHKLKHAALRYEVGISVSSGCIVWIFGPFSTGKWNDQPIFNKRMALELNENEKVLADHGYGGSKIIHDGLFDDPQNDQAKKYRAYHESVNGRLKAFSCLQHRWRYMLDRHHLCVFAVANLVQAELGAR